MRHPSTEQSCTAHRRYWWAHCLALLCVLLVATLAAPVSHAQDSGRATNSEAPLLAEPPLNPESQGPAMPGDASAEQVIHIAEVTIDSAEDVARLLEIGYTCAEGAEDDRDIWLQRWINTAFDGQPVNQSWYLRGDSSLRRVWNTYIDHWILRVYYCAAPPSAPALVAPAHRIRTYDGTPTSEWAYMSEAHLYHIQVDDDASFTSREYDSNVYESQLTPGHGLSPGKYYWRVPAWSPCGWGAYSSTREFVDAPAVPRRFLSLGQGAQPCDLHVARQGGTKVERRCVRLRL